MYQEPSSSFIKPHAYVSPQPPKPEVQHKKEGNEKGGHSSTSVKRERKNSNYSNDKPIPQTPPKRDPHPPGWERITWAPKVHKKNKCHTPTKRDPHPPGWDKITWAPRAPPKVCRKPVRRMDFGEISTAAH